MIAALENVDTGVTFTRSGWPSALVDITAAKTGTLLGEPRPPTRTLAAEVASSI